MKIACATVIAAWTVAMSLHATDTNIYYLPLDPRAYLGLTRPPENPQQVEAARRAPESRPAELDPEGHWGTITSGFQMGIRFATNTFALGQPIKATVIIRNASTNSLVLFYPQIESIHLVATNSPGNVRPQPTQKLRVSGPIGLGFPEHRQKNYNIDVDQALNFNTPGTYQIVAKRLIHADAGGANVELYSASAPIKLIPVNEGPGGTNSTKPRQ